MPDFDPKTWELLKAMFLMAVLLIIVALGIQMIAIYRRRITTRSSDFKAEQVELFRDAYESGEISTDEYRQIQDALDRGQAPPAMRIAPFTERHSTSSNDADEKTQTSSRDTEDARALDQSHEGGTEEPDLPRPGG